MGTRPCGATWPVECTSSAARTAAAASVSTALVTAACTAALHGFAEVGVVSMTSIFSTARRREVEFGEVGGVFWKNSSGGLMRSDDLTSLIWVSFV